MKYILALDQGTTSCRAFIFDELGQIVASAQQPFAQIYPEIGWVEQDPLEIWNTQLKVLKEAVQKSRIQAEDIAGIGITNQRETTVIWDKNTGQPVYNAIVWQDKRTANFCETLKQDTSFARYITDNTGLVIDSYFSGTKIHWILENVPQAKEKAINGDLLFGTIDTWLIWNLSEGSIHATDYSNASRTLLYNIKDLQWDKSILQKLEIPESLLPQVYNSSGIIGATAKNLLGVEVSIAGIAGDQQAALFGQACFESGSAKNTYGTGCFILKNTGKTLYPSPSGLINTIAWGINNEITYASEGSIFAAGAAINWLKDSIHLLDEISDSDYFAQKVGDSDGVYVVPAFSGLGAPYWDMYAKGAMFGLSLRTTKNHIIRATLEALAYRTKDVLDAMQKDTGLRLESLKVDGGVSKNDFLMQFQANMLNVQVLKPASHEVTVKGAAFLAGLGVGLWTMEQITQLIKIETTYSPQMESSQREKLYKGWQKAVKRALEWEKD